MPFVAQLATNGNQKHCFLLFLIRVRRLSITFLIAANPVYIWIAKVQLHISPELSAFEPWHDITNRMSECKAKTQIRLGIHPVWSESLLCAQWFIRLLRTLLSLCWQRGLWSDRWFSHIVAHLFYSLFWTPSGLLSSSQSRTVTAPPVNISNNGMESTKYETALCK